MPDTPLRTEAVTPCIGAEILDVDLRTISDAQVAEIRRIWLDKLVVFFREQTLAPEEFVAFARRFGDIKLNYKPATRLPGHPEITHMIVDKDTKTQPGERWHSDGPADPEPPMASILYLQTMPQSGGGDTLFANCYAAYEALPPDLQIFLDGLTAINDRAFSLLPYGGKIALQPGEEAPISEHPVIRVHPETGRKGIFVNPSYTTRIVQLDKQHSDDILAMLFRQIESPQFQCRFKWRPGSIAFWDNRCAQHLAIWDYYPHTRIGYRISLAGDAPYGVAGASVVTDREKSYQD